MVRRLLQDEKIVSVTGTLLFHLLLFLLFLLIQVDFRPVMEEFAELTISGGFQAPVLRRPTEPAMAQAENPPEQEAPLPSTPEKIELPEHRQLDLNEEEIIEKVQPELEKRFARGGMVKKSPNVLPPLAKGKETTAPFTRREKAMESGLFKKQLDEKLFSGTQRFQIDSNREFEIDWEGEIQREIYQKTLPAFPPDVQREATIKIKFTVLPNGLVGSAVLLQKGDTKLENLTLEAFKTWRFNPLPSYVEQVPQSGIITFHFKLK